MNLSEFLTTVPPGESRQIAQIGKLDVGGYFKIGFPSLFLYCTSPICDDVVIYDPLKKSTSLLKGRFTDEIVDYNCRLCTRSPKTFAMRLWIMDAAGEGMAHKFGEIPAFGEPIPPKAIKLIEKDRELFLKGKKAEDQGMGIAAFTYYRRVVENQKNQIIDEIIRVSKHLNAPKELLGQLEIAKKEISFTRAVDSIKEGIPDVLKLKGYNPLKLLHGPLSKGIHELSEEECLGLARDVRLVLNGLAERIEQAMKDQAELNEAVGRLLQSKEKKESHKNNKPE